MAAMTMMTVMTMTVMTMMTAVTVMAMMTLTAMALHGVTDLAAGCRHRRWELPPGRGLGGGAAAHVEVRALAGQLGIELLGTGHPT